MTLHNHTGPNGRVLLLSGLICFAAGIVIVVARLHDPTPGVVIVAGAAVIAGFTLTTTGILALFSRPVWIEGTVVETRWTISGVRRIGTAVLDIGEADLLTIHLDHAIARELQRGDRVRVQHNSLNRTQAYQVEIISRAKA